MELRRNATRIVAAALLAITLLPLQAIAATIYTTGSSDTLNTFRTNVNSSLTNLNTDRLSTSTLPTIGHLPYFTGLAALGSVATSAPTQGAGIIITGNGSLVGGTATFAVNTSLNVAKLTNLSTNGFVKASGGDGTLIIDTSTYLTASGAVTSIAGTANQLTASAATGAVTLSLPSHVIFPSSFQALLASTTSATSTNLAATNLTSTNLTVTGTLISTAATSSLQATSISGAISLLGEYFTNFTAYVRGLITCGRSLTCTNGQVDADSELYTFGVGANLVATSTTSGIATGTPAMVWKQVPVASTITAFDCGVAPGAKTGTSTIRAVVATDAIGTGMTDLLYATGVRCGSDQDISTTTFSQTAINAGDWIGFYVSDAEPTGRRPGRINPNFTLTKND